MLHALLHYRNKHFAFSNNISFDLEPLIEEESRKYFHNLVKALAYIKVFLKERKIS